MRKLLGAVLAILAWVLFQACSVAAGLIGLVAFAEKRYAMSLFRAQDRTAAAVFGWSGEFTISAECGSRRKACLFCRVVCRVLGWVWPNHCRDAARAEGLG